ncbi:hypothetical protein CLIB1444_21S01200 [[Candida] jaroonii]|uniref:Uncharacterized protein n=1 Tax=[Candida] jaroonii TaxID=467808 RepID=A0ACA9YFN2_9ASCO|nr:hypothetical protein CLIB1444_21S01200 [[Candida] jaroonii]
MEIDELEYLNLDIDYDPQVEDRSTLFMKQTLMHSPIFQNIFPRFHVSTANNIRQIRNLSHQDDSDQYLSLQEEDSQFGTFNDDDLLMDMSQSQSQNKDVKDMYDTDNKTTKLQIISVIVKNTSLLVNGLHFPFNSNIRSSCIIKGIRNERVQEEDSLLISLKSGFLLLIRFFYVPITFHDNDFNENFGDKKKVFKPFVVQWWDTSSELRSPSIFSSGNNLYSHCSGLAAVSTSSSSCFRIYNCNHTKLGVVFQPHYNVVVDGSILHGCFAQPIKGSILDNHVMFLTMNYTTVSTLELNLYSWITTDKINESLGKSSLPLPGDFPLPSFIASLSNNGSFLFVTPGELIIITVHDITSAEFNFKRERFPGSFPTNYYYPKTNIVLNTDESNIDELLISTDNGSIYSVIINKGVISQVKLIVRISDPISIFTLEANSNGYDLIYGSDTGLNRHIFIEKLLTDTTPNSYSQSLLLTSYKNWAPIFDVQIIDSFKSRNCYQNTKNEFWCISGIGKRARLSHLRNGYSLARTTTPYQSLRKVEKMFVLDIHGTTYVCCSLPFETVFLEYQPQNDDPLIEVSEVCINYDSPTLLMSMVSEDLCVQITPHKVIITSIGSFVGLKDYDEVIVICDIIDDKVIIVSQLDATNYQLELLQISTELTILYKSEVNMQVSSLKLISVDDGLSIVLGSFESEVRTIELVKGANHMQDEDSLTFMENSVSTVNLHEFIDTDDTLIPQNMLFANGRILLGTRDGYLFQFNPGMSFQNYYKLSDTNVELHQVSSNLNKILVSCKSLWLVDFDDYGHPEPILFDEKNDKIVKTVAPMISHTQVGFSLLMVRDEGLSVANISDYKIPNIKQINIGDAAKKFIYLPFLSVFMILTDSKDAKARLRFVDRKTYKLLPHTEMVSRSKGLEDSIFEKDEYPVCCKIWSLDKLGKKSKKILIGCSNGTKGSFKILDITKVSTEENKSAIKCVQLIEFKHSSPINCIEQVDSNIIFSSENSIYSTVYNIEGKRLQPVSSMVTLTSPITSIVVEDSLISLTTKFDSIYQFMFKKEDLKASLSFIAEDPLSKSIANHAIVGDKVVVADKYHSDIIIMDKKAKNLVSTGTYKTFGVPRVYKGDFQYYWAPNHCNNSFVSVTVDGEVTIFKEINEDSLEYQDLDNHFNISGKPQDKLFPVQVWDAPFTDKITGKGLKSINKPYFRNKDNKKGMIDYDIEDISRVCKSYTSL